MSSSNVSVTVAKNAGFCFGVARAAKFVEQEIKNAIPGQRIFTLGKLIHNDTYNAYLESCGVGVTSAEDIENLCTSATDSSPVKVFVRAHGISRETKRLLDECAMKNPHFEYVDCTCVFVDKIHKIVREHNDPDGLLLVLGDDTHPEVLGFCSQFDGKVVIFENEKELLEFIESKKIDNVCAKTPIVVAQTTQNLIQFV